MCSLSSFQPPPPQGYVTVCEQKGEFRAVPEDRYDAEKTKDDLFEDICINLHRTKVRLSKDCARLAFLEHKETLKKQLFHAWYENGITGVLQEISNESREPTWVTAIASGLLKALQWSASVHNVIFPHSSIPGDELISEYSVNRDWYGSVIRCFAWHPHVNKLAVALGDNTIQIHTCDKPDIVPLLKHKLLKDIADIAWKPHAGSVLAIACGSCILVWPMDPNSLSTRPSSSAVQVLDTCRHRPVCSLAWDPNGRLLLSSSPADSSLMVWDIALDKKVALRRGKSNGISRIAWSPDGSKVHCASTMSMFRVWETQKWNCEHWSQLHSRCQTSCWSPDGDVLLFATADEPIIYSLLFPTIADHEGTINGSKSAIASADLSAVEVDSDQVYRVGGCISQMVWDPKGQRLAVLFTENCINFVTIFQTRIKPTFEIIPCGFVRGFKDEIPNLISFHPKFDQGALLTVVWHTGRISHVPMHFITNTHAELYGIRGDLTF